MVSNNSRVWVAETWLIQGLSHRPVAARASTIHYRLSNYENLTNYAESIKSNTRSTHFDADDGRAEIVERSNAETGRGPELVLGDGFGQFERRLVEFGRVAEVRGGRDGGDGAAAGGGVEGELKVR